ncbi:ferredoxin [Candidatus Peregrinibacteria bacterium HGW-Peregrinibacteria-1]|nr:MAG: ferredoxin [Candidatus Peregrinibacteria bacterium HGW-Peregrinibacteria-1]
MATVTFSNNGESEEVENGADLKEVTKDAGWPIAYGCEDGMCGTCVIEVEEGQENLSAPTENEEQTLSIMGLEAGKTRLSCQCKVNGNCQIKSV